MTIFRLAAVLWVLLNLSVAQAGEGQQLQRKLHALQQAFCGQQKQEEIEKKIQRMVEDRLGALSALARSRQASVEEITASIKEQIWSTFHVHALCLEHSTLSRARITGPIHGYFTGSFLFNYGFETLIHEGGKAAMACMMYQNPIVDFHVVRFDVFVHFAKEVFAGHDALASFGEFINPVSMAYAGSEGGTSSGWVGYSTANGFTPLGASAGSNGATAAIMLGGLIFTTIAQITGIIVGMYLKDKHPFLGYTLIVASASSYVTELINWFVIAAAVQNGGMASSELAHFSLALGISSFVVPGVMLGVTVAAVGTYIAVTRYLKHLKELRVSAKSLLSEGVLSSIQGEKEKLLDELWAKYPRKVQFDEAIAAMEQHMEHEAEKYLDLQVKLLSERKIMEREGDRFSGHDKPWSDYLPDGSSVKKFWKKFQGTRKVKAYTSELKAFHQFIGNSDASVDLGSQDELSKAAIAKILQGNFLSEKEGWFAKTLAPHEKREKAVASYLEGRSALPLHTLVTANIARIKYNEKLAKKSGTRRWRAVLRYEDFKALKNRRSLWFRMNHITYTFFMQDLEFNLQGALLRFAKAKDKNDLEGMKKSAKDLLKNVLFVPKDHRDIEGALGVLSTYVNAVQGQQREKMGKRWFLDVVDEESCRVEVNFVCSIAGMINKDKLLEGQEYLCPLQAPQSCTELIIGKGLLRSVFAH
jgi:hypothetical protein